VRVLHHTILDHLLLVAAPVRPSPTRDLHLGRARLADATPTPAVRQQSDELAAPAQAPATAPAPHRLALVADKIPGPLLPADDHSRATPPHPLPQVAPTALPYQAGSAPAAPAVATTPALPLARPLDAVALLSPNVVVILHPRHLLEETDRGMRPPRRVRQRI
jgi:hypothetical protein